MRYLKSQSCEIQTIRLNKTPGVWFLATFEDNTICIDNASAHTPLARISGKRYISEQEFIKISYYYEGWLGGKYKRNNIRNESQNTSYIFALINYFSGKGR
jgi:hypothetical protein